MSIPNQIGEYVSATSKSCRRNLNDLISPKNIFIMWLFYSNIADPLGTFDSLRVKKAQIQHNPTNPIKTVASVVDGYSMNGWHPILYRTVKFTDGTDTRLTYHTHWYLNYRDGPLFEPKPGEQFEVFNYRSLPGIGPLGSGLVQKIKTP